MRTRDIILNRRKAAEQKQDIKQQWRTVVTAADGSRTAGTPWANKNARLVYHQLFGSGSIGLARWELSGEPEVGLGCIAELRKDNWYINSEDTFLRQTATDGRSYDTLRVADLQPGGRSLMWVDTRQITPLATWPEASGLIVNVEPGYYPYAGTRKLYAGTQTTLTQNPNPGEHYYAGLYLDSANTLQVVYGTSIATSSTPPEPAWPDGAFLLSVVRINDTQTSIAFKREDDADNDIFDRRMAFSDELSSKSNVWPLPGLVNIGATEYTTLTLANTAAIAGDLIRLGEGEIDVAANFTLVADALLAGSGRDVSVIVLAAGVVFTVPGSAVMQDLSVTSGATEDVSITDTTLINVGFGDVALTIDGGAMYGGHIAGDVTFANTPFLDFPVIEGTVTGAFTGHYLDGSGNIVPASGWPFTDTLTVDPSDTDADYSSLAAGVAGISAGQRLLIGSNLTGTSGVSIGAAIGLIGTAQNVTISGSGHQAILTIIAAVLLENLSLSNSYNSGTIYCINLAANATFRNVSLSITSGNTGGRRGLQAAACSPDLYDCEIDITSVGGQTAEGIYAQTSGTVDIYGGRINVSGPGTNYAVYADTGTTIRLHGVTIESGSIGGAGTVTGHYYDAAGNLITLDNTSQSAGVWLIDESGVLKTKYATLPVAVTAAATGDKIKLFAGTYTITGAALSLSKTIEVEGDGISRTIITSSLSNSPTIDVTADSVTFKNLTIQHTGTGASAGPLSTDNANLVLDNVYLDKTSGASTTSYGLWMYGGSVTLKNGTLISCTAGTTKYGIYNDTADCTVNIWGGQVGGDTTDIFTARAGSVLTLTGPILTNGLIGWSGTGTGFYVYNGKILGVGVCRPITSTENVYQCVGVSDSDFTSTIATLPGGATLTYGAVTTGAANNLVPSATTQLAKMVLHNTTRSTDALISNANTGTSTITLTANVPANWQVGDTITIRSQVNTDNPSGGSRFVDFEIVSGLPQAVSKIVLAAFFTDTGTAPAIFYLHPYEAGVAFKRFVMRTQVANIQMGGTAPEIGLVSNRFCMAWDATGAGTFTLTIRIFEADGL